jgi:hypothetical protein
MLRMRDGSFIYVQCGVMSWQMRCHGVTVLQAARKAALSNGSRRQFKRPIQRDVEHQGYTETAVLKQAIFPRTSTTPRLIFRISNQWMS